MSLKIENMALEQTTAILHDALKRFAKEDKGKEVEPHQVKIMIGTKCGSTPQNPDYFDPENTEPYYYVLKNDVPHMRVRKNKDLPNGQEETCEVTFNQILDVKWDVLQKGTFASAYLSAMIKRFSEELQTDPRNIEIMVLTPAEKEEIIPIPFLYDRGSDAPDEPVKQLDWVKDVFIQNKEIDSQIMG